MVCGNTILHEEAFCYHRGTHCEHIFENNQRDFLASSGGAAGEQPQTEAAAEEEEYFEDYVDKINQKEQHQSHLPQESKSKTALNISFEKLGQTRQIFFSIL